MILSDLNVHEGWLVTLSLLLLMSALPAVANSDDKKNSYYSTDWQINYQCIPDDNWSMGVTGSHVGKSDFSSTYKFLVSWEDGEFRFKEFDDSKWKDLKVVQHQFQYSYLDRFSHFSFFPRGVNSLTFKYDQWLPGYHRDQHSDIYYGISLIGSCSAIE